MVWLETIEQKVSIETKKLALNKIKIIWIKTLAEFNATTFLLNVEKCLIKAANAQLNYKFYSFITCIQIVTIILNLHCIYILYTHNIKH